MEVNGGRNGAAARGGEGTESMDPSTERVFPLSDNGSSAVREGGCCSVCLVGFACIPGHRYL